MINQGIPNQAKPSTFNELLNKFADQLDKMEKNNSRLKQITGFMEVETPTEPSPNKEAAEVEPFNEGSLLYFHRHLSNLIRQNQQFDYQLSRLEKHI